MPSFIAALQHNVQADLAKKVGAPAAAKAMTAAVQRGQANIAAHPSTLWKTGKRMGYTNPERITQGIKNHNDGWGPDNLLAGESLYPGESLVNGKGYTFSLLPNGDVSVKVDGQEKWSLKGKKLASVYMKADGNLEFLDAKGTVAWQSSALSDAMKHGARAQFAHLVIQDDGNAVVYGQQWSKQPLWATGTQKKGGLFGDAFDFISNAVKSCGRAIGNAIHEVAKGAAAIGKALSKIPIVGPLLHGVWVGLTGPLTFADAIAQGKGLDGAIMDFIKEQMKAIHEIAPYAQMIISCIPGIGPIASAVIGTAIALAEGQSIGDALLAGITAAIPGGAIARMAFDVGKAALQGKPLEQVGLAAVEGIADAVGIQIPDTVKTMLSTAVDMTKKLANGVKLDAALLAEAGKALPAIMGAAAGPLLQQAGGALGDAFQTVARSSVVQSIEHSGVVQAVAGAASDVAKVVQAQAQIADALLSHGQKMIPNISKAASDALHNGLSIGMTMGHTMNLQSVMKGNVTGDDVLGTLVNKGQEVAGQIANKAVQTAEQMATNAVVGAARKLVPADAVRGFDIAIGLAQHQTNPFSVLAIQNHLTPAQQGGFATGMSLHIARVAMKPPPASKNPTAQAGYFTMLGSMGSGQAITVHIATTLAANPVAKSGAMVAVEKVAVLQGEPWYEALLRFFGLHPNPQHAAT